MGTRVQYEFADADSVDSSIILFANNSHPNVDPDALFMEIVASAVNINQAVIDILQATYPSSGGNHIAGGSIFTVDLVPEDREYRLIAQFSGTFESEMVDEVTFIKMFDDETYETIERATPVP